MKHLSLNFKSIAVPLFLIIGGCASVMLGSFQDVSIETKCADKKVKAECLVKNEMGEWFVRTPGTINLHKGYDELELTCKGNDFEPHKVSISSSGNVTLLGNALVGGGLGAIVDLETKAGFEYPTKITFVVKSCEMPDSAKTDQTKAKSLASESNSETEAEAVKTYPVSRGLSSADGSTKVVKSGPLETRDTKPNTPATLSLKKAEPQLQDPNKLDAGKLDDKTGDEATKREPAKPKLGPYCRQVDSEFPGCTIR